MHVRRGVLRLSALAALCAGTTLPAAAQFRQRVAWPLVDLLVRGDSGGQLEILASPNLSSVQGRGAKTQITRIAPTPVEALQWAAVMGRLMDSIKTLPRRVAATVLRPGLGGHGAGDTIFLGMAERGGSARFRFMVTDADTSRSWQAAVTFDETRGFLQALSAIAGAVLVPERRDDRLRHDADKPWCQILNDSATTDEDLDTLPDVTAAELMYPPMEEHRGREGRVWLRFVIDTTAQVAPGSACVLFADSDAFAAAVLRALPKFRLRPGFKEGKPVAALVFQEYRFSLRRP